MAARRPVQKGKYKLIELAASFRLVKCRYDRNAEGCKPRPPLAQSEHRHPNSIKLKDLFSANLASVNKLGSCAHGTVDFSARCDTADTTTARRIERLFIKWELLDARPRRYRAETVVKGRERSTSATGQ